MNIYRIVFDEQVRDEHGQDAVRSDPAIVACEGDAMEACSALLDRVRGERSCEDCDEDGKILRWKVVGIDVVSIDHICTVDHWPQAQMKATG